MSLEKDNVNRNFLSIGVIRHNDMSRLEALFLYYLFPVTPKRMAEETRPSSKPVQHAEKGS